MAKVDILLPYWGDFKLLKKAVDSVLAQTESDWRLLIVDDCYPSAEAAEAYSHHSDPRISYQRHNENLGLVKNFSFVLGLARADYCTLMGCDDMLLPSYLETALGKIGEADYYQPGVRIIDESDNPYLPVADRVKKFLRPSKAGIYRGEKIATSLCHGNWLYLPSIVWRTTSLQRYGFDITKKNTQDVIAELSILRDGGSVYIDDTVTFLYRRSAASFSSRAKSGDRFIEENTTYAQFANEFRTMGWRKASMAARVHATVRLHQLLS